MNQLSLFKRDEYNPYIITTLNDINKNEKNSDLLCCDEDKVKRLFSRMEEFKNGYERINREILEKIPFKDRKPYTDWFPIAYRLEPIFESMTEDELSVPKTGGIPDMTYWYRFAYNYDAVNWKGEKERTPSIEELVDTYWPKCGCCGKPMQFIGQFDIGEWLLAIHKMTYSVKHKEYRNDKYCQQSAMGYYREVEQHYSILTNWYYIFYCDCGAFDNKNKDAVILMEHRYDRQTDRNKCYFNIEEYKKIVSEYMKKHGIFQGSRNTEMSGDIPLQKVIDYKLRFDIDIIGYENKIHNYINHWDKEKPSVCPDLFEYSRSNFSFFGAPSSQQEPKRFACENTYPVLHRQAPILNWNDTEHDMTYQIYGCQRCIGQENNKIYCKVDSSCT